MKKIVSILFVLALCLAPAVQAAEAEPSEEQVYRAMIALEAQYPEGMPWTNDNFYEWNGGIYSGGFGCAAFAFALSDAAFGDLPARMLETFDYADVRVGNILRLEGNVHSVIVLEVYEDHLVIAEGNYNSSIHWGRELSKEEVLMADNMITRYPERAEDVPSESANPDEPAGPAADVAYASSQTVIVDGVPVEFQMYALKDAQGNDTNYIRLRDLAHVLNGTEARFDVTYDQASGRVGAVPGQAYTGGGTEMTTPFSGNQSYSGGVLPLNVTGTDWNLRAITLTDSKGGGYTYFQLRELGQALGFRVGYTSEIGIFVETT